MFQNNQQYTRTEQNMARWKSIEREERYPVNFSANVLVPTASGIAVALPWGIVATNAAAFLIEF